MIYFIECESGHVKIGFTNRGIYGRLAHAKCANPLSVTLFKTIKGDRAKERAIHDLFKKDHVHGEWFVFTDEIREFAINKGNTFTPVVIKTKKPTKAKIYPDLFEQIEKKFGNHTKAAIALGITPRQYRRIRAGKCGVRRSFLVYMKIVLKGKA